MDLTLADFGWRTFFQAQLDCAAGIGCRPVRVTAVHRDKIEVAAPGIEARIEPFRGDLSHEEDVATVGDWLILDAGGERASRRLERYSLFKRRAIGKGRRVQLIAANVDTLFIVTSCNQEFNPARLERFLSLGRAAEVTPVIVLTKADLTDDAADYAARVREAMPDVLVEIIDARKPEDAAHLAGWCGHGQTIAMAGSSGVGKSTLVNTLMGASAQETGAVREDDDRGRHTTSSRSLHRMRSGSWLLDMPGMREVQLTGVAEAIDQVFADRNCADLRRPLKTRMFQTFEERGDPQWARERLPALRRHLAKSGCDGFILPRTDAHQSEYLADHDQRLTWLTGFTGSAGTAIILAERAVIFVDGRYTVQVARQVDGKLFNIVNVTDKNPSDWIADEAGEGTRLGYDPWLHTPDGLERLRKAAEKAGAELVALATNPVDAIWTGQPEPPSAPIVPHPLKFAGELTGAKLMHLREELAKTGSDALVLSLSDSIAWLFNIRGSDVAHTPVALAFAIITRDKATLFCDPQKVGPDTAAWLAPHVTTEHESKLGPALDALGAQAATVQIDPASSPVWIVERLDAAGADIGREPDPCTAAKALKNQTEIAGARTAHLRDAIALARFLSWLDTEAPSGNTDEISAVKRLEELRAQSNALRDASFETIAGSGPNGAIVHYRVNEYTNRPLEPGSLFLVDSGAQYRDGTTDVTRTVAIGTPSDEMQRLFTLVLKGHIAIATARFPQGTAGVQLDALARIALWRAGHDYDHGTGHGVGSYLGVHEGPQGISKRAKVSLEPGMILSDEPGVYIEGAFGIRIENLLLVREPEPIDHGARPMLSFETLTLAPIDLRLVEPRMLSQAELEWLNAYHARVRDELASQLQSLERDWLIAATVPISAG